MAGMFASSLAPAAGVFGRVATAIPGAGIAAAGKAAGAATTAFAPKVKLAPAPAASPYAKTPAGVKLTGTQTVHYTEGKGYYAAEPTPVPASQFVPGQGVQTQGQINTDAANTANTDISGAQAPILANQATQDAAYTGQAQATAGFNLAADKMLTGQAQQIQGDYNTAAGDLSGMASKFAGAQSASLADEQAATTASAVANGAPPGGAAPAAPGSPTGGINPQAIGNAEAYQGGFIPSQSMVRQGLSDATLAHGETNVNVAQGQQDEMSIQNAESKNNEAITSQLAAISAKYPSLFSAQEHQDIQDNVAAINLKNTATVDQGKLNTDQATVTHDAAENANLGSEVMYRTTQGNVAITNADTKVAVANNTALYHAQTIQLGKNKVALTKWNDQVTQGIKEQANTLKAQGLIQAGEKVNAAASKVQGFMVNALGNAILGANGQPIPVDPKDYTSSVASAKLTPAGRVQTASAWLVTTYGKDTGADKPTATSSIQRLSGAGNYIAAPGATGAGVTPPSNIAPYATTDDPRLAQNGVPPFATLVQQMALTAGIPTSKARAIAIREGFKPDSIRPLGTTPKKPAGKSTTTGD
jgi:hypothetical protein